MALDLSKVEEKAPHLVDLVKHTGAVLLAKGLDPSQYKAAVIATFDHSGSTEFPQNKLYTRGVMQQTADIVFAAGLQLDDDGQVPVSLFESAVHDLGEVTLDNCRGFLNQHSKYRLGGTNYGAALRWIVKTAGFGNVDLGSLGGWRGGRLSVKATAKYPTYALFVTDGEPGDRESDIEDYLRLMSQLPIFVQFVGVGTHNFEFLKRLDGLKGRLIDNASFFDAKDVGHDQDQMLELMLGEFPDYYRQARQDRLLVG